MYNDVIDTEKFLALTKEYEEVVVHVSSTEKATAMHTLLKHLGYLVYFLHLTHIVREYGDDLCFFIPCDKNKRSIHVMYGPSRCIERSTSGKRYILVEYEDLLVGNIVSFDDIKGLLMVSSSAP